MAEDDLDISGIIRYVLMTYGVDNLSEDQRITIKQMVIHLAAEVKKACRYHYTRQRSNDEQAASE